MKSTTAILTVLSLIAVGASKHSSGVFAGSRLLSILRVLCGIVHSLDSKPNRTRVNLVVR
jgi:hypothetical protein